MPPIILDARTATDHFPGIGRYVVNLASALQRVSPNLDLALLRNAKRPDAARRLTLPDLPALDCAVSPFALAQQWRVRSILRQSHAALYHSAYYLMPYATGVPTIVTCYDLIPLIYPQYYTAVQRLIFRTAHRLALRTARVTLAISEATKTDLVRFFHIDPLRVVVTPLAADIHFRPPARAETEQLRQRYTLPDRYVLYFGSNKPHKNLPRLIHAFEQLRIKKRGLGIGLVIAGHWDERFPQAKELAEQLDLNELVRFIGPVKEVDLPALYGGAEVFAFPSEYEGFGLPVLEAMACGAPVVCANQSSLPEVAGDAALTFPPYDVAAMADAIERVLSDEGLRTSLQSKSQRRASQFSWDQTAVKTLDVYRQYGLPADPVRNSLPIS